MAPRDMFIDDLTMTVRTYNTLAKAGLLSLSEIHGRGWRRLFQVPRLGRETFAEIKGLLSSNGYPPLEEYGSMT